MEYTIVLPNVKNFGNRQQLRIYKFAACLYILNAYEPIITVLPDDEILRNRLPAVFPPQGRSRIRSFWVESREAFFMINDSLFLIIDNDDFTGNYEENIKFFDDLGVCGIFCANRRRSTEFIFQKSPFPMFGTTPGIEPYRLPMPEFEHFGHSNYMNMKKDISIFFSGRCNTRISRLAYLHMIKEKFPDALVHNSEHKGSTSPEEYVKKLRRAKIAWCPRSVKSRPDFDCNSSTGREMEALCLEVLVVRPPIGIIEIEPRIDGVHYVEVKNDGSDVIDKMEYYLAHDEERLAIARNGRLWWERNSSAVARAYNIFNNSKIAMEQKSN